MLVLVAAFNRLVDPFWYYRDVSITGFNAIKPKFARYERHVKPSILIREQPASVIFGSSYSEIGFDPAHLASLAGGSSYNFAMAGAPWNMVYCHVRFAMRYDKGLRQIVLGIHPQSMPARDCTADINAMLHPDQLSFLLSSDALKASIETVLEQRKNKPSHTAAGLYFYTRGLPGTETRFHEYLPTHAPCKLGRGDPVVRREEDPLDLAGLQSIVQSAVGRGIAMKLVVYPRHALPVELEYLCGARQARWDALSKIVAMVERVSGKDSHVEVWDFEGYHRIATERISNAPGVYWQDPAHFNYEYGDIILDEMYGKRAPLYGIRLTSQNIRAREKSETIARNAYVSTHPGLQRQLMKLLR